MKGTIAHRLTKPSIHYGQGRGANQPSNHVVGLGGGNWGTQREPQKNEEQMQEWKHEGCSSMKMPQCNKVRSKIIWFAKDGVELEWPEQSNGHNTTEVL